MDTIPHQHTPHTRYVEPTYGGWARPTPQGIPGLSPVATGVAILGLLAAIPTWMLAGTLAGVLVVGVFLLLLAILGVRVAGRSVGQRAAARTVFAVATASGRTVYRSGPASPRPSAGHRLPGLLADAVCHAPVGPTGEPFALLEHPGGRWSIVLACDPTGEDLVDEQTLDERVAAWGGFLTELSCWPDVRLVQQTVQTGPDDGSELAAAIDRLLDQATGTAPIATEALRETAAALTGGCVQRRSWCAVTFATASVAARASEDRRVEVMGRHLARLLPALQVGLTASGAGGVHPMSPSQLAQLVGTAFDPTAVAAGNGWSWGQAGPVTAVESWGAWRHDSATSITWSMTEAPAGAVTRNALSALLAPDLSGATRRVCLTYRPHRPETARVLAGRGVRQAAWRITGRPGLGDARDDLGLAAARQTQRELAQGAALVSFAAHVTSTVVGDDPADLDLAVIETETAAAAAGIGLRRCWAHQNAAFATALGLGVDLAAHTRVPASVRDNL
jgi:hypothetical protein